MRIPHARVLLTPADTPDGPKGVWWAKGHTSTNSVVGMLCGRGVTDTVSKCSSTGIYVRREGTFEDFCGVAWGLKQGVEESAAGGRRPIRENPKVDGGGSREASWTSTPSTHWRFDHLPCRGSDRQGEEDRRFRKLTEARSPHCWEEDYDETFLHR